MRSSRFLAFINKPFALLGIYIFFSVMLMNFSDTASLRGIRWAVLRTVGIIDSFKAELAWRKNMEAENEALKRENFKLHIANQKLREIVLENARLKEMLALEPDNNYKYIAARIIATGTENGINTRILNVGEQDSVSENMAVVNADGLVGKIIEVGKKESVVQLLMDHDCWVGVRLQKSREMGIVGWDGNPWLNLHYIPKNIPIEVGELVLTSGMSRIYPADLKVGLISKIDEDENEMFQKIWVKPAVNFNSIEEVFVIRTERAGKPVTK